MTHRSLGLWCQALAVMAVVAVRPAVGQPFTFRDRGFYWYGVGAGIAITVCELERIGDVGKGFARRFIRDARSHDEIRKQTKTLEGLLDASRSANCRGL